MGQRFDGRVFAQRKLQQVQQEAAQRREQLGRPLAMMSIFPFEDEASVIYTKLKRKDALEAGIQYATVPLSLRDSRYQWFEAIQAANRNPKIDGVLVQKPTSQKFCEVTGLQQSDFTDWWSSISESITPQKDVDCLGPAQLFLLQNQAQGVRESKHVVLENLDHWVLPATAQAVIDILLDMAGDLDQLRQRSVAVIGRSVIVGKPAAYGLSMLGVPNTLLSSKDSLVERLPEFSAVISATGKSDLISADWIQPGSFLVDVGAPSAEFQPACYEKAVLWTPVPYGVGPVTRACLLENLLKLL